MAGRPADEFFTALGAGWRLTATQRARLAAAVTAAVDAGWTPRALAAFAGANTIGVRNPYAVLAVRLSPAELPPPQTERPSRPPWCGECDQATRMLAFDGDAPRPCPRCKPKACTIQSRNNRAVLIPCLVPDPSVAVMVIACDGHSEPARKRHVHKDSQFGTPSGRHGK
ncbi:MAG: hypothetical protein ACLP52_10030 [Streptosporangiaceae bacterium]